MAKAAAKQVNVALVGLGFGAEFIPIYQHHPDAEMVAVCRRNKAELDRCAKQFSIPFAYTDYDELLTQDYDQDSARHFVADEITAVLNDWGVRRRLSGED